MAYTGMSNLPPAHTDPGDMDPDDIRKARGSGAPSFGPWLVILVILLVGAAAFVAFAL
ncbi:MAG TPA: hypothetical protein VGB60_07215 [Brevundimonas sp.]|uniref:hypothetical protein n=1 Tax=Brevundimonas sp. TaxID=1871086 RepID=UPI002ED996BB